MDIELEHKRHSLAHLLAATVRELYPGAKNAIGPAIEEGFYQDFALPKPLSEDDLQKIEHRMREKLKNWNSFERREVSADEARKEFSWNEFKVELIDEFAQEAKRLTFYTIDGFVDLCRGGHVENPSKDIDPESFKLDRLAGAYWRGDEKNPMLTRIYGLAFNTKAELDAYSAQREEAKKRDHRKLGKELDLFTFSDLVGSGLPMFTPKGTVLREEINKFSQELREANGFQKVWIPHITKKDLYETSGHWDKFGDELFLVKSQETKDQLVMKPMNCPHHQQIYASQPRSYKDLPIKYLETTTVYRDEKAGELLGLSRVRCITQDDSHIFCMSEQLDEVFRDVLVIVKKFYATLAMPLKIRLSFRDPKNPDKYLGEVALWKEAQDIIRTKAESAGLEFFEAEGEAAFYGPKIDFIATDSIGRDWQVATAQLDFVQPARFKISYTDKDGKNQTPIMIHFAIAGSLERFLSVYIEHTGGAFPFWMSPVQVKVLPISENHVEYGGKVLKSLKDAGLRAEMDDANESLGKKIRNAKQEKVPYIFVVGDKEIEANAVGVETRAGSEGPQPVDAMVSRLVEEYKSRK